jgi:hypothetical protein
MHTSMWICRFLDFFTTRGNRESLDFFGRLRLKDFKQFEKKFASQLKNKNFEKKLNKASNAALHVVG